MLSMGVGRLAGPSASKVLYISKQASKLQRLDMLFGVEMERARCTTRRFVVGVVGAGTTL